MKGSDAWFEFLDDMDNNVEAFLALHPLRNYLRVLFHGDLEKPNWKLVRNNLKWFLQDSPFNFGYAPEWEAREGNLHLHDFIELGDPDKDYNLWGIAKFLGERGFTFRKWILLYHGEGWGPVWKRKMVIDGVKPPFGFVLKKGAEFLTKFRFDFEKLERECEDDKRYELYFKLERKDKWFERFFQSRVPNNWRKECSLHETGYYFIMKKYGTGITEEDF